MFHRKIRKVERTVYFFTVPAFAATDAADAADAGAGAGTTGFAEDEDVDVAEDEEVDVAEDEEVDVAEDITTAIGTGTVGKGIFVKKSTYLLSRRGAALFL